MFVLLLVVSGCYCWALVQLVLVGFDGMLALLVVAAVGGGDVLVVVSELGGVMKVSALSCEVIHIVCE